MATTTVPHNYKFNHSTVRVKDPVETIKFYEFLGLKVLDKTSRADSALYSLGYDSPKALSHGKALGSRQGLIQLLHNFGTENDADFKVNNGNADPHRGFGHFCVSVDNIQAACARLEKAGYKFQKRLTDGKMQHIAFVLDPNSYWVEIIGQKPLGATEGVTETDVSTYHMNHTMIRVKDAEKSLSFYQDVLGMTLIRSHKFDSFHLYFLGYPGRDGIASSDAGTADREGLLELTWNCGTEKDEGFRYHDGNAEPKGFSHISVSVDNIEAACKRFEGLQVEFKTLLSDDEAKGSATLLDPDGYSVKVISQ